MANPPDRLAHGNIPLIEWYLQQMKAYEVANGKRLLDYVDVHYYPENVKLEPAGNAAKQALRLRSTRSLWDPTYVDESYIAQPVRLISPDARVGRERLLPGPNYRSGNTTGARWRA